jgi:hypothetical protein
MLCYGVGDLSQITRHASKVPQTLACSPAGRTARPGSCQPIAVLCPGRGVFRWLSHVCGRVSAPPSPPAPTHAPLPTPTVRSWGTLLPVLRPRRYPYLPYLLLSSFPPRPSSLLSAQDDEEGVAS